MQEQIKTVIPIREEFDDNQGRLLNYDAYGQAQRTALPRQKHVDIRSFEQAPLTTRAIMLHLNQFSMESLSANARSMTELEQDVAIRRGEEWTTGTVEKQADRHNWSGISIVCAGGTQTVTQSVIPKVAT